MSFCLPDKHLTYFLELDKLRYTGRPARPDTVAALKVEWVNPGSWTGELPAEKDLVSAWMITLFVFPGIELKTRHKLIFSNIYDVLYESAHLLKFQFYLIKTFRYQYCL